MRAVCVRYSHAVVFSGPGVEILKSFFEGDDDEVDDVPRLQLQMVPDLLGNGDLALAGETSAWRLHYSR